MTTETRISPSSATRSEASGRPGRPFRSLRWFNGGVHWISGAVLVYAFISNGETTHALINPVAWLSASFSLSGLSGCKAGGQAAGDGPARRFDCRFPRSGE